MATLLLRTTCKAIANRRASLGFLEKGVQACTLRSPRRVTHDDAYAFVLTRATKGQCDFQYVATTKPAMRLR